MKKFIRYLYEYQNGKRIRNVGFVRTEESDDSAVIQIYGQGFPVSDGQTLEIFLFYLMGNQTVGIYMGEIPGTRSAFGYRLAYSAEDAGGIDFFNKIEGMILRKKRNEEEELTKNIKQIKLTKEGFKNKLDEFKEWEEKKKQRINQLKKEQAQKNKKELQQSSNKNYTKKEINDTINRLYKEDLNKKKYIIHQTGAIFHSNKKGKNQTEHNTRKTSLSHDKGYKPFLTSASKNE